MLYISHTHPTDTFDPINHKQQHLNVFNVHLKHAEGKPPTVRLTITKPSMGGDFAQDILAPGQRFFLAYEHDHTVQLLFAGRVLHPPKPGANHVWNLDLVADSSTVDLKPLRAVHQRAPHWDPLFLPPSQRDRLQGLVLHYGRADATVRLVNPFQPATVSRHLNGNFYQDTLVVHQKAPPPKKIHGEIAVEWIQRYHGLTDISGMLVREFPERSIATLTPEDFRKRWWKPQQAVKNTGYKIIQAQLNQVQASSISSVPFMVGGHETTLPCQGFEPTLVVQWRYRQKRREVLRFTIHNPASHAVGEHTMSWHLQDITADTTTPHWQPSMAYGAGDTVQYGDRGYRCTNAHTSGTHFAAHRGCWGDAPLSCALDAPWRASFLTTPRGQEVLDHALYQARYYMQQQMRSTEITFRMPLQDALGLDIGQHLQLTDTLQGQVIAYAFWLDGQTGAAEAHVTLGQTDHPGNLAEISYRPYDHQLPKHGILHPQNLGPQDLVKAVLYKNMAGVQNDLLRCQSFPSITAAQSLLTQNRTAVQIHLQDLVSSDVLDHGIEIETFYLRG